MVWMKRKFVNALGTVKDRTKIGLAKVSLRNNRLRELEIAIVKATSHNADVHPAEDDKYATEFLQIICDAPDFVCDAAVALTKRFGKTRRWAVALKCVRLLHRLLRVGNGRFAKDILDARAVGLLRFEFKDLKDDAFFDFVRSYSWFVDEAVEGGFDCLQGAEGNDKFIENLIDRAPKVQRLLDCAIACLPSGTAIGSRLVAVALEPVVRESFRLYTEICICIAALLDNFFDMRRSLCASAFEIYKKAAFQSQRLATFYDSCKTLGACGCSEYPTVEMICNAHVETLEDFMTQITGRSAREIQSETECESSSNESVCSPSPVKRLPLMAGQGRKSLRDLMTFEPVPSQEEKNNITCRDLITFEPVSSPEEKNKFTLALFPNRLETRITNVWEGFDSPKPKQEESINSCSWELALDMSAASTASVKDPFAASAGIAPPSYVEMEDIRRKYACMLQQQQFWQNYNTMRMHGFLQVQYYNPFCVPMIQNIPFGILRAHPALQSFYNTPGIA